MPRLEALSPGRCGVFRIDLGQGDEGATVVGPRFKLRQLIDGQRLCQHRASGAATGPHMPRRRQRSQGPERLLPELVRIGLQRYQTPHMGQRATKYESRSFDGPEQIGDHRELAPHNILEQDCRSITQVDTPLDFGRLKVRAERVRPDARVGPPAGDRLHTVCKFRYAMVIPLVSCLRCCPIQAQR